MSPMITLEHHLLNYHGQILNALRYSQISYQVIIFTKCQMIILCYLIVTIIVVLLIILCLVYFSLLQLLPVQLLARYNYHYEQKYAYCLYRLYFMTIY